MWLSPDLTVTEPQVHSGSQLSGATAVAQVAVNAVASQAASDAATTRERRGPAAFPTGQSATSGGSSSNRISSKAEASSLWGWRFCVSAASRQDVLSLYAALGPSLCCAPASLPRLEPNSPAAAAPKQQEQQQGQKEAEEVYEALSHAYSPVLSVSLLQWLTCDLGQHPEVITAARSCPQAAAALGLEAAATAAAGGTSSLALVPAAAYDPSLLLALLGATDPMGEVSPTPLQTAALAVVRGFAEVRLLLLLLLFRCCCCWFCSCTDDVCLVLRRTRRGWAVASATRQSLSVTPQAAAQQQHQPRQYHHQQVLPMCVGMPLNHV